MCGESAEPFACSLRHPRWPVHAALGVLLLAGFACAQEKPAEPHPIFQAARSALAEGRVGQSKVLGFHDRDRSFSELPRDGAILVGFECGIGKFIDIDTVYALRPIFMTPTGDFYGQDHGLFADRKLPSGRVIKTRVLRTTRVRAEPGYAVGAMTIRAGLNINGLSLTFYRIQGNGLNVGSSYTSAWIGDRTGGRAGFLSSEGAPIVGLIGSQDDTRVGALGLQFIHPTWSSPKPADPKVEQPVEKKAAEPPPEAKGEQPVDLAGKVSEPGTSTETLEGVPSASGRGWIGIAVFAFVTVGVLGVLLLVTQLQKKAVSVGQSARPQAPAGGGRPTKPTIPGAITAIPPAVGAPPGAITTLPPAPDPAEPPRSPPTTSSAPPWSMPPPSVTNSEGSVAMAKARKEVSNVLFLIAGLQFVCGMIAVTVFPAQVAAGQPQQVLPLMTFMMIGIALGFAGLGYWALSQPFPAAVVGLAIYIPLTMCDVAGHLMNNSPGVIGAIIVKVAFIAALVKAARLASQAQQSQSTSFSPPDTSWPAPPPPPPPAPVTEEQHLASAVATELNQPALARSYQHSGCGSTTTVSGDDYVLLECPFRPVDSTFCCGCSQFVPLDSVRWTDSGEPIAEYRKRIAAGVSFWRKVYLRLFGNAFEGAVNLRLDRQGRPSRP